MSEKKKYSILIVAYEASLLQILTFVKNLKKENPLAIVHLLTNRKMDAVTCELKDYVSEKFVFMNFMAVFGTRRYQVT